MFILQAADNKNIEMFLGSKQDQEEAGGYFIPDNWGKILKKKKTKR